MRPRTHECGRRDGNLAGREDTAPRGLFTSDRAGARRKPLGRDPSQAHLRPKGRFSHLEHYLPILVYTTPVMPSRAAALALVAVASLGAAQALANGSDSGGDIGAVDLRHTAIPDEVLGRPLVAVSIVNPAGRWVQRESLSRVRLGESLSPELARRAMSELLATGRYAEANVMAVMRLDGVELRLVVTPRRVAKEVRVQGSSFETSEVLRAAGLDAGDELTPATLDHARESLQRWLGDRGLPFAKVTVRTVDTDDPIFVVVRLAVEEGPPRTIRARRFELSPFPGHPGLAPLLRSYRVPAGAVADEVPLAEADTNLAERLRSAGWVEATVHHDIRGSSRPELVVVVDAGPRYVARFEGARRFDSNTLHSALELDAKKEHSPSLLLDRLRDFYRKHGMLDARIGLWEGASVDGTTKTLLFTIREGEPVRVVRRVYPCLTGPRDPRQVDAEIESFLEEELPGPSFFGAADAGNVDSSLAPAGGQRAHPFVPSPYQTYVPEVYERASAHLQDLYRSEGWLSATVDPPVLLRRRCRPGSRPGRCDPIGQTPEPGFPCSYDRHGIPVPLDETAPASTCDPKASVGARCETEALLSIPIRLGPRTSLYDVDFSGNEGVIDAELLEASELELGAPVSLAALETARQQIVALYEEEGFAFATVEHALEFSQDHSRGRVRFDIRERERVTVSKIIIQGARRTNESLIRGRIALVEGGVYRRSAVRATEERLATLGVFSSITVAMEDPHVPAREKVVLVRVDERAPQYLDVRPGFSTGEGMRVAFEYGHRNLAAEAIALTLRVQLGYLPSALIMEGDVRRKYNELRDVERLERRNSARLELPEIGLGPLFPFSVEGVDVRDNARDFGLTKDAAVVTLSYRPSRRFSIQLGASLELNTATIFGTDASTERAIAAYVAAHPSSRNSFRVPEGTSAALAQRIGFAWDRRDNPLDATSGTFVSTSIEHVRARPVSDSEEGLDSSTALSDPFALTTSEFLRFTQRLALYIPIGKKGTALATSFSWGRNYQLPVKGSRTYPDRLFFLGGASSLRGFLQDSLVPEDLAQQLLAPNSDLTLNQVVIRGGDFFVNPRAELRIPLGEIVQTALFADAGNLWGNLDNQNFLRLRYAIGSGLRVATPVGPLAFDYGFNVERVLDRMFPNRSNQRTWESLGAFHFSIGLF